jgi:acyl-CoA reductase-like NAD-dependent aldehyde dehydrogenase
VGGTSEPSPIGAGPLIDPNTGDELAENRSSNLEQVARAVEAADEAHRSEVWQARAISERASVLLRWADLLDERVEEIARLDALNSGVPISVTRLFAAANGDTVRTAVAHADAAMRDRPLERNVVLRRLAWGPTALIAPWNAPSAMAVKKLAYALAAGAAAILKPSPASPWSAEVVVAALYEAGLPDGAAGLVLGGADVGAALVADTRIRAIAMTGSTETGRRIAATAAPRFARLRLELGSNNPAVVRADADAARAAFAIASGALKLSGQWCEAPRRVLAARPVFAELVDELRDRFAAVRIGASLAEDTQLGPVAFAGRRRDLERQTAELVQQGGDVGARPPVPERGSFFPPTVVAGERLTAPGELFGPLITVEPVDSDDEAVMRAEEGPVGLAGYIFGEDEDAAASFGRRLTAGEVKINGTSVLDMADQSAQSFFGDSGIGGHGDADVLDFFAGRQVIGTDRPGLPL